MSLYGWDNLQRIIIQNIDGNDDDDDLELLIGNDDVNEDEDDLHQLINAQSEQDHLYYVPTSMSQIGFYTMTS